MKSSSQLRSLRSDGSGLDSSRFDPVRVGFFADSAEGPKPDPESGSNVPTRL